MSSAFDTRQLSEGKGFALIDIRINKMEQEMSITIKKSDLQVKYLIGRSL